MAAYVVRSGARVLPNIEELEHFTLSEGLLSVSFVYDDAETEGEGFRQSVLDFDTSAEMRVAMQEVMSEGSARSAAAQLWRFAHEMLVDDMVVLPRHAASSSVVAVGRVVGPYFFENDHHPNAVGPHLRRAFWYTWSLPRENLGELQPHMENNETVYPLNRYTELAEQLIRHSLNFHMIEHPSGVLH